MFLLNRYSFRKTCIVLLFGSFLLLLSCQTDTFVSGPDSPTGLHVNYNELRLKSFRLNQAISATEQGQNHTGQSPRLYAGILDNGEMVSAFINIRSEILNSHQICSSDNIIDFNLILNTLTTLTSEDTTEFYIAKDSLKVNLIVGANSLDEEAILYNDDVELIKNQGTISSIPDSFIELSKNKIKINLYDYDNAIYNHICIDQENVGFEISYFPPDFSPEESTEKFIELHSSDVAVNNTRPTLNMEYSIDQPYTYSINRCSIKDLSWSDNFPEADGLAGLYFIEDSSSIQFEIDSEDIITNSLNTELELLQINLELNLSIESYIDSSISFVLDSAYAFIADQDPMGDNWHDDNSDGDWNDGEGTEDNKQWDPGEPFHDFGIDNCPDSLEISNNLCDVEGVEISIYNPTGTEGNNLLDWTDADDENGVWDEGEGEQWFDWGFDGCPDRFETGSNENQCLEFLNPDYEEGLDLNIDNFIDDPKGDDWNAETNPTGTEGNNLLDWTDADNENGVWDEGEGEKWFDWGIDGLSADLPGVDPDETEGNFAYDVGEPFHDTGSDGKFSSDEDGYNIDGTEGNGECDSGSEFNDCGEDNCCDLDNNEGLCDDAENDNYNIDPNEDNWSIENSTLTEGNGQLDWTDADDENGVWDEGEGEKWFDWGIDGIPDSLEAFQTNMQIKPLLYENSYIIDIENNPMEFSPDLGADTVSLWISAIEKTENGLSIKVSLKTDVKLKGLQFKLKHIPYTMVGTVKTPYQQSVSYYEDNDLFEDITLYPYIPKDISDTKLQINYANDLSVHLEFDSLSDFLQNKKVHLSHEFTYFVMYIDSISVIHADGMFLNLGYNNDSEEYSTLYTYPVLSDLDSIVLPIGDILRRFQNGDFGTFNKFILKTDGDTYNYSKLVLSNTPNTKINIMYSE